MTDERYFRNKINLLSFALTIAVIWVHAFNVEYAGNLLTGINFFAPGQEALSAELRMTPEGEFAFFAACIENIFSELLGQGAVPGFFMISAYLFYRNIGPRLYPGKLIIKWKRRVRSLLIPYLLWNLWYFLLSFADSGGRLEVSAASLFDAIVNYRYNPVFWYMKQLIMLTVLAPFVFVALKNRNTARLFLLLSFLGAAFWTRIPYHIVNEDALFYYLFFFFFAMHLRQEAESEHESSLWLKRGVILSYYKLWDSGWDLFCGGAPFQVGACYRPYGAPESRSSHGPVLFCLPRHGDIQKKIREGGGPARISQHMLFCLCHPLYGDKGGKQGG